MAPSDRQQHLLTTDRWRWLGTSLDHWYLDPLDATDAVTPQDLAESEERLGRSLPQTLREWFDLVGARLHNIQDSPARPRSISADEDIPLWTENQWVWTLTVDDDDQVHIDGEGDFPTVPAPTALAAMVVSDTIVGAFSGRPYGPLGQFRDEVRGGVIDDISPDELRACRDAYPLLGLPASPFFTDPPFGDDTTWLRPDALGGLEWATADNAAFAAFAAFVDLDPPGGEHQVRMTLRLPAHATGLLDQTGRLDLARFDASPGRVGSDSWNDDSIEIIATTTDPRRTGETLLAGLPPHLTAVAVLDTRPLRLSRWTDLLVS